MLWFGKIKWNVIVCVFSCRSFLNVLGWESRMYLGNVYYIWINNLCCCCRLKFWDVVGSVSWGGIRVCGI